MVETKTFFCDNSPREVTGTASQHGRSDEATNISATAGHFRAVHASGAQT